MQIRRKQCIDFVFVLNDLSVWKTEPLYKMMLNHPRFNPQLIISPSRETPNSYLKLVEYLEGKKYDFIILDESKSINNLHADIVMYQKPYKVSVSELHIPQKNRKALIVYAPYGFTNIMESWSYQNSFFRYCWQYYQENLICAKATTKHLGFYGRNVLVTGTPMMDELNKPKSSFDNPWRDLRKRKHIIYAPHHTIGNQHLSGISYSTFLEYAYFILELAKKYSDSTYWAFKPHPFLKTKLEKEWGRERAEQYYQAWDNLENAQVELGQYIGLFKYSDAMIHDCSTFTQEYMYANRPVMFLVKNEHHSDNLNDFAKVTFNLHVHGHNKEDIEKFVLDIIAGIDEKKVERDNFYTNSLLPPHGKTACENIINAILGQEEYA